MFISSFFFNDTATTEIYTLSLHDALPISRGGAQLVRGLVAARPVQRDRAEPEAVQREHERHREQPAVDPALVDRKSTRLNSSYANISYAVFCLKKKTNDTCITN